MTNIEIVMMNQVELAKAGKIGAEEDIHTYQKWKELGYQVKKGEHAVTKFPIWKPAVKKATTDDEKDKSYMFMKMASFFSTTQVEPIQ